MEVRILGPLTVHSSGQIVRIPGDRQRRLLAVLLLNANQVVPFERLIDELWDDPPRSVRQQVHNAVARLRAALAVPDEPTRIVRTDVGYTLRLPDGALDAERFREHIQAAELAESAGRLPAAVGWLEAALDLWRGEALAGLDGRAIGSAAAALNEQRLSAVEALMALRLRLASSGPIVGDLRRLVAEHPLRESLRGLLMQALHRSGRRAEALSVYDEGRRLMADELGLDPSEQLRRLHAAILNDTADLADTPLAGMSADAAGIPAESADQEPGADAEPRVEPGTEHGPDTRSFLPRDIRDFSGRSAELARLIAESSGATPSAVVIIVIDGMGGVGKTTLAIHLAHRIAHLFPDGQYFVDLHGYSPGADAVTPEQALGMLLRDGGVPPELIQHGRDGRSAQWRSHLAGRRVLLVLDNAIDAAHVRPLLPGTAGAVVVITSRRKLFALEGSVSLSLDVLPVDDAVALFTRVAGTERAAAEPEAVAAAVELCGRLPLAVRIAAARLRDRTRWRVADLVDRLKDHSKRRQFLQVGDHSVLAVLRLSYRYLPLPQQRLFRLLSLHPGTDFDAGAAAALAGTSPDLAESYLDALFDDNLLLQATTGRFHLHDLVHDCAGQILTETGDEPERRDAQRRLFDHYLHALRTWTAGLDNRIYHHPAPTMPAQPRLDLLDLEFQNFTAVARYTEANSWPDFAWQFACLLQPVLAARNYPDGSYDLFHGGVRAARLVGDARAESACLQGLAAVCREHLATDEAGQYLEQALRLSRRLGDQDSEAAQLVDLGNIRLNDDRLDDARAAFEAAEKLLAPSTKPLLRAAIDNNLGVVYRDLGQYDEALRRLNRALASAGNRPPDVALLTAWSIAAIHHFRGEHDRALIGFERIRRDGAERGFQHGEAVALLGLSTVHRSLGDPDRALRLGRQALALARHLRLPKLECETLIAVGEAILSRNPDQAEDVFHLAEQQAATLAVKRYQARANEGLAHTAAARGRHAIARQHWERAIALYPAGMADARYARHHLTSPATATCFRCSPRTHPVDTA